MEQPASSVRQFDRPLRLFGLASGFATLTLGVLVVAGWYRVGGKLFRLQNKGRLDGILINYTRWLLRVIREQVR